MDPLIGSALITGAGSLSSSLFGSSSAKKQQEAESKQAFGLQLQQQIYNTQEREASQSYNTAMWNLQNEYNSPLMQLERAMDAGINPNVVFSKGLTGNVANNSPSSSPQSSGIVGVPSIASGMLTSGAVNANLMSQAAKTAVDAAREKVGLSYDEVTFEQRVKNATMINEREQAQIDALYAKSNLDDVSADVQQGTFNILLRKSEHELALLKEQVNIAYNQNQNLLKDLSVKDSQIKANDASARLFNEQADLVNVETDGKIMDNDIKQLEVNLSNILGAPLGTNEEKVLFGLFKSGQLQSFIDLVEILATSSDSKGSNWLSKLSDKWNDFKRNHPILGAFDLGEKGVEYKARKRASPYSPDDPQPYRSTYSNDRTTLNPSW